MLPLTTIPAGRITRFGAAPSLTSSSNLEVEMKTTTLIPNAAEHVSARHAAIFAPVLEARATEPGPAPPRTLLSLAEAASVVPLSEKTLYRVAQEGRGPFLKVEGRWIVYEDELHEWVQSHRPDGAGASTSVRRPRRRRGSGMRARVLESVE
jgi:excisionase family DNA binding protein